MTATTATAVQAPGWRAWAVVLAAGLVFFAQSGLAGYLLGVFQPVWLAEFGWPQTWLSIAYAIGSILPGLTGVIIGRWTDQYGPRIILIGGAVVTGLGFLLLAGVSSFPLFCVAFAVGALGRCGMSQVPASAAVARWFTERRALAMGLASTGISLAGVILVPLVTWIILTAGWRTAVLILGGGVWLILIPVIFVALRGTPAVAVEASSRPAASLGGAMRDLTFWLVATGQMLGAAGSLSIGIHAQKAIIDKGMTAGEAASAISLMALCALISRFIYSWLGDLLPAAPLLAVSYLFQAAGFVLLALSEAGIGVWLFPVIYGLSLGGTFALQAIIIIDRFGVAGYAAILGAISLPSSIASAIGPVVAAAGHDLTGSYTIPFLAFGAITVSGAVCYLLVYLRRP